MEKRPDNNGPDPPAERRRGDADEFWDGIGVDIERLSPKAQVVTSLAVLIPVTLGIVLVLTQITWLWWLVFVFGWTLFPAFGLLVRGIAGLSEDRSGAPAGASGKERELLQALREHGELTPAQAAMETSLTVAEADGMLKELTEAGHLQVRVRGGGLFYSLWEVESGAEAGRLEGR